jgi:hypothetical protein
MLTALAILVVGLVMPVQLNLKSQHTYCIKLTETGLGMMLINKKTIPIKFRYPLRPAF